VPELGSLGSVRGAFSNERVWSSSVMSWLGRRRMGQFEGAVCDSRGGGFAVARDLHCRESEFDAIGIEGLFDHGVTCGPAQYGADLKAAGNRGMERRASTHKVGSRARVQ
jgi:hypothetical protein